MSINEVAGQPLKGDYQLLPEIVRKVYLLSMQAYT